ncbi:hypothetical protein FOL46_001441 [Perkinsus olseni]|uniref:GIY-YIG domain-containing protein n=1 Tax=Perkinsus olseni TaxID=32597 RepID=A0A7J6MCY9_PEROL|nr:hypothetical protein FOL46_001441 [Perkinsus olseni]
MLASLSWHLGRAAPVVVRRLPLIPLRHRCHSCTKVNYNTIRLVQRENPATWHLILDKDFTEKWLPPPVRISHCDNPHCRTCAVLRETRPAVRTLNHGWMEEGELSCRSKNLVYALQCRGCGILYVGETGRELRQRLSSHLQIKGNGPMSIHYRNDAEVCPLCTDNFDSDDKQKHMSLDNFDVVILESLFFDGEQYTSPLEEARIRRARSNPELSTVGESTIIVHHASLKACLSLAYDQEKYCPRRVARRKILPSPVEGNDEVEGDEAVQQPPADEQPVLRAKRRAKDKALGNMKAFLDAQSDESGFGDLDSLND